jgi:hypothetical protein
MTTSTRATAWASSAEASVPQADRGEMVVPGCRYGPPPGRLQKANPDGKVTSWKWDAGKSRKAKVWNVAVK